MQGIGDGFRGVALEVAAELYGAAEDERVTRVVGDGGFEYCGYGEEVCGVGAAVGAGAGGILGVAGVGCAGGEEGAF